MLALGVEYLTGYVVATDVSSRDEAEWPPHPARVFMALAAAWFETGEAPAEGEALRLLERAGDPFLVLPEEATPRRSTVRLFVPVNDSAGPSAASLQSAPALARGRQERTMPRRWIGDGRVFLRWEDIEPDDQELQALASLCRRVTRIGHSSSLVQVWVADDPPSPTLEPADGLSRTRVRAIRAGLLDHLRESYGEERRGRFRELDRRIRSAKGKAKKAAQNEFEEEFGVRWKSGAEPPPPTRPKVGVWCGYRAVSTPVDLGYGGRQFSREIVVLCGDRRPRLGLESTLQLCHALRGALLTHCHEKPRWLTGHDNEGAPDTTKNGHLAIVPLAFVGHEHADGRILGLGLVLPSAVDREEATRVLGPALFDAETGEPRQLALRLGRLGEWILRRDEADHVRRQRTLMPETWGAGAHEGARRWATATPIVLDRFPKADRARDPEAWRGQVSDIIASSCALTGLSEPTAIDVDTTSWLSGVPRATPKERRLRPEGDAREGRLGDGFPRYPARRGGPRPQVHALLEFDRPLRGPVLLGAGRFFGYGFCRPLPERTEGGVA